jgi:hypothetical protein
MKRIRSFGCSITGHHHWRFLSGDRNIELAHCDGDEFVVNGFDVKSYAILGGSNDMQHIQYANEVYHDNILKDDIIIWQITNPTRKMISNDSLSFDKSKWSWWRRNASKDNDAILEGGFLDVENIFDLDHRIKGFDVTVGGSRELVSKKFKNDWLTINETNTSLYSLLWQLNGVKRENKKLLILFGWDDMFSTPFAKNQVIKFLKDKDIDYISSSILDWTIKEGYEPAITSHPQLDGYYAFTNQMLMPKLKELGWITD